MVQPKCLVGVCQKCLGQRFERQMVLGLVVLRVARLLQVQVGFVVVVVRQGSESEVGLEWEKRGQKILCQMR